MAVGYSLSFVDLLPLDENCNATMQGGTVACSTVETSYFIFLSLFLRIAPNGCCSASWASATNDSLHMLKIDKKNKYKKTSYFLI